MTDTPKGADVVLAVETPGGPMGAIALGLFVEPAEQRRIDRVREEYAARQALRR